MKNLIKHVIYVHLPTCLMFVGTVMAGDRPEGNGPQQITGDYRVAITQICVRTPYQAPPASGFDPNTQQLLTDGETVTAIGSGLLRFDDEGKVEILEGVQTEVSLNQTASGKTP